MNIPFWKMHGAANDFILVDDRKGQFPVQDRDWMASAMARHTGIGSDGIILIQPSTDADFRMRFFNPDGGEAEMCGNGARCVARLAHEIGAAEKSMGFNTVAGNVRAELLEAGAVRIHMTEPRDLRLSQTLSLESGPVEYSFVNTGVPHVIIQVPAIEDIDIQSLGSGIRHHENFSPAGANVNFIQVTGPDSLRVRTYERGVEGETLACGTGITACGIIAGKLGLVTAPVNITAASEDIVRIDYLMDEDGVRNVTMTGPAVHVFQGQLTYPS